MSKIKEKNKDNYENEIKIKDEKSSLSEFVKRPLPTEDEIEEFEEIIEEEAREGEVEDSLSEIYQDEEGNMVDVKKLNIVKKRKFIFLFFSFIFSVVVLVSLGYGVYYYIFISSGSDVTAIEFFIEGEDKVMAGEEFFYTIKYKNLSNVDIQNVRIEIIYPENFVFLDSLPPPQDFQEEMKEPEETDSTASEPIKRVRSSVWQFDKLISRGNGDIKIKGKIIDEKDSKSILLAKMIYTPENFSSEFKKESSYITSIKDIGIDLDFDYLTTILVDEVNEIIISFKNQENNFLQEFRLVIDQLENMELISTEVLSPQRRDEKGGLTLKVNQVRPGVWKISGLKEEKQELKIKYRFNKKITAKQNIILRFENTAEDNQEYSFLEKNISLEVMKNDLNLILIINGSRNDQGVNFDQTLNYSIVYTNKGETSMKDVVIMAVLASDFLDWTTLEDKNKGREKGNTITWSKEEIPALEELKQDDEGIIDFSINMMELGEIDLSKDFLVKSFVQFSVGNIDELSAGSEEDIDNRSNIIINKINSDLSLKEEIRYFNEDNLPVGTGPLPPKVGEATSFKVYWVLTNNLHELSDTQVEVSLPEYISWDNKNRTSVGVISYDSDNHKVVWQVGRLPIIVYRAEAEFNISITPQENDRNKIMVLLPGSIAQAIDNETKDSISSRTRAKTTKLEDDEIASINNDGRVE